jgi:hypothetical protein
LAICFDSTKKHNVVDNALLMNAGRLMEVGGRVQFAESGAKFVSKQRLSLQITIKHLRFSPGCSTTSLLLKIKRDLILDKLLVHTTLGIWSLH